MLTNPMIANNQDSFILPKYSGSFSAPNTGFKDFLFSAAKNINTSNYAVKKNQSFFSESSISNTSEKISDSDKTPEYQISTLKEEGGSTKGNSETVQKAEKEIKDLLKELEAFPNDIQNIIFNSNLLNQLTNKDIPLNGSGNNINFDLSEISKTGQSNVQNVENNFSELKKLITEISGQKNNGNDNESLKEILSKMTEQLSGNSGNNNNFRNGGELFVKNLIEKVSNFLNQNGKMTDLNTEEFKNLLLSFASTNENSSPENAENIMNFIKENMDTIKSEFEKAGIKFETANVKGINVKTDSNTKDETINENPILVNAEKEVKEIKIQKESGNSNGLADFSNDDFLNKETSGIVKGEFRSGFERFINIKLAESIQQPEKTNTTADTQQIIDTIVKDVTQTVQNGKTELEVKLMPENLGKLTIKVSFEEGKLNAQIEVKNPEVKHIIESNILKMRDDLSQNGVNLEKINILLSNQENFESHQGKYFRHERFQHQSISGFDFAPPIEELEMVRTMGYNTIEYTA